MEMPYKAMSSVYIQSRVVSSPSGINYFLGLSSFFEVIRRALKSCATLITRACACA